MVEATFVQKLALFASISVPFFNIPLICRMLKRQSSDDVSLTWAIGVYVCFLLMLPQGLLSDDIVFKVFSIANITFFSVVVFVAVGLRLKKHKS